MSLPIQHKNLFNFAKALEDDWSTDGSSIDYSDAETLVGLIKEMGSDRAYSEVLTDICIYAHTVEDWDSGEVGNWPQQVMTELQKPIKRHGYTFDGDNEEAEYIVHSVPLYGPHTYIGSLASKEIALELITTLDGTTPVDVLDGMIDLIDEAKEECEGEIEDAFRYVNFNLSATVSE